MPATNDITGDLIQTKVKSKEYEENHAKIFGEKKRKSDAEYWERLRLETEARIKQAEQV
jgi:hypothetical protein